MSVSTERPLHLEALISSISACTLSDHGGTPASTCCGAALSVANARCKSPAAFRGRIKALQHTVQQRCSSTAGENRTRHARHFLHGASCTDLNNTESTCIMQVPVLTRDTADHLPVNGLVRFRGMVSLALSMQGETSSIHVAPQYLAAECAGCSGDGFRGLCQRGTLLHTT